MAERELRDENTAPDPIENNLDDLVRVDGPSKLAHEDTVPETQREIDSDAEFREGTDIEGGKTARELHDERVEAGESHPVKGDGTHVQRTDSDES